MINNYCSHEAGVRNLRKCIDRVFRKITIKIEDKKLIAAEATPLNNEENQIGNE